MSRLLLPTELMILNRPSAVCAIFIVLHPHYSVIYGTDTKPPGTFEVPLITAFAVGGGGLYTKNRKQAADKGVEPFFMGQGHACPPVH